MYFLAGLAELYNVRMLNKAIRLADFAPKFSTAQDGDTFAPSVGQTSLYVFSWLYSRSKHEQENKQHVSSTVLFPSSGKEICFDDSGWPGSEPWLKWLVSYEL